MIFNQVLEAPGISALYLQGKRTGGGGGNLVPSRPKTFSSSQASDHARALSSETAFFGFFFPKNYNHVFGVFCEGCQHGDRPPVAGRSTMPGLLNSGSDPASFSFSLLT